MDIVIFSLLAIVLVLVWIKLNNIQAILEDWDENGLHESLQMAISDESIQTIVELVLKQLEEIKSKKNETV